MVKIVDSLDWGTGNPVYYMLGMGNSVFDVLNSASGYAYNAANDWALRAIDEDTLRFEVRAGDEIRWGIDVGTHKERSEISAADHIALGQNLHTSFDFNLEPGAANTAKWLLVSQLIQFPPDVSMAAPPPVAIELVGEKLSVMVRYQSDSGKTVEQRVWLDSADIARGSDYHFDVYANVANDGSGRVVVAIDGKVVVDYSGRVGYNFGGDLAWKQGIYRNEAPETIAAQFSNLQIDHGDMVKIPAPGKYTLPAEAPTLALASSGAEGAGAESVFNGHAVAGVTVHLYDGTKLVGTTQADANGAFTFIVDSAAGSHMFKAATEVDGKMSATSDDISVQVGTSADILARMDVIAGQDRLGAIVLTDTRTFTLTSTSQLATLMADAKDALTKVVGGANFLQITGTGDNRYSTFLDLDGKPTLVINDTYKNGVLIRQTKDYVTANADGVQKEVVAYNVTGQSYVTQYQAFNAAGQMTECVRYHADGTLDFRSRLLDNGDQTTEKFNVAGLLQSYSIQHASGPIAMEMYQANIVGQPYVATWTALNAAGKIVYSTRTNADGSLQYDMKMNPDGSTIAHLYGVDGALAQLTVTTADGRTVNQGYAGGKLVSTSTTFADKSTENNSWSDGQLLSQTITHMSGPVTKEIYSNGVSGQSYARTYKAYSGSTLVTEERFHSDNTLDYARYTLSNGATEIRRYATNGAITSDTITALDGSTDVKSYTNGVLMRETVTFAKPVDGVAKQIYEFNIVGQASSIRLNSYDASGKLVSTSYPTATSLPDFAKAQPVITSGGEAAHSQPILSEAVDKDGFHAINDTLGAIGGLDNVHHVDTHPVTPAELDLPASPANQAPPTLPPEPVHVDAPSLTLSAPIGSDGHAQTTIAGTASGAARVQIYDGGNLLGSATIDGNGHFSFDLTMGSGLHNITAVSVHATGVTSQASTAASMFVGTAADFVANIAAIDAAPNLAGVVLTDGQVLNLTSEAQLRDILSNEQIALSAINGAFEFVVTTGTPANLIRTTYDSHGTKLLMVERVMDGNALVQEIIENPKAAAGAVARQVQSFSHNGEDYASQIDMYTADGRLVKVVRYYPDGAVQYDRSIGPDGVDTVHQYRADGTLEQQSIVDAHGVTTLDQMAIDGSLLHRSVIGTAADEALSLSDHHGGSLFGGAGDDNLVGGNGNDILDGGAGADRMDGGAGDDTYYVDHAGDHIVDSSGVDTVLTGLRNYVLGDGLEKLTFTGSGNATLIGNQRDNVIIGGAGDDSLDGGMGNDILYGGDGNDQLNGGRGADILYGGNGDDRYIVDDVNDQVTEYAGGGLDTVAAYVSYALSANVENLTLASTAGAINGIGNTLDNLITGNNAANRLEGGDGNDKLVGNGGNDILIGGAGDDLLMGGDGNDVLIGGSGNDMLYGGAGADRFVFRYGEAGSKGGNTTRIADFSVTQGDKIDLSEFDANPDMHGRQALTYYADRPTTPMDHSVWFVNNGNFAQLHGDLNGDGVVDFVIRVDNLNGLPLGANSLIL